MSQQKKVWIILLSVITIFASIVFYTGYTRVQGIKKNKIIVVGQIVKIEKEFAAKGQGEQFVFEYIVNGENYHYSRGGVWPKSSSVFLDKTFPIACDSTNPEKGAMMIFPKDFELYAVPFPDSLQWVLPYYLP